MLADDIVMTLVFHPDIGVLITGGHINPAVTIAFIVSNKVSVIRGACYIVMQVSPIAQTTLNLADSVGLEFQDVQGVVYIFLNVYEQAHAHKQDSLQESRVSSGQGLRGCMFTSIHSGMTQAF